MHKWNDRKRQKTRWYPASDRIDERVGEQDGYVDDWKRESNPSLASGDSCNQEYRDHEDEDQGGEMSELDSSTGFAKP